MVGKGNLPFLFVEVNYLFFFIEKKIEYLNSTIKEGNLTNEISIKNLANQMAGKINLSLLNCWVVLLVFFIEKKIEYL